MNDAYVAFVGSRCIAHGALQEVLPVLRERFVRDPGEVVLVFETEGGKQVDFDLRGTLEEILERALPSRAGPGRPKLGVLSREVSLLPRHWDWLEAQPSGISATLRRLVEAAARAKPERARQSQAAVGRMLTVLAGDRPGYEEAMRALYAGDTERFEALTKRWPKDLRELAAARLRDPSSGRPV